MGPEMLLISAALQVAQGFAANSQAKAQAKATERAAGYNAQIIQQQSDIEKTKLKKQQRLLASTQRVKGAGSGATLDSFDDVFEDTTTQSLLDVALLDYNTRLRRDQVLYEGRSAAASQRAQGKSNLFGSIVGAGSTVAGGFGGGGQFGGGTTKLSNGETINWFKR